MHNKLHHKSKKLTTSTEKKSFLHKTIKRRTSSSTSPHFSDLPASSSSSTSASKSSQLSLPSARTYTRLLVIDAFSILFRSHFALQRQHLRRGSDGRVVSGLSGFANTLLKITNEVKPTHLAVCMDTPATIGFRRKIFPGYKKDRGGRDDDLVWQIQQLPYVVQALGIPTLFIPGYEADDVIASVCHKVKEEKDTLKDLFIQHNIDQNDPDAIKSQQLRAENKFFDDGYGVFGNNSANKYRSETRSTTKRTNTIPDYSNFPHNPDEIEDNYIVLRNIDETGQREEVVIKKTHSELMWEKDYYLTRIQTLPPPPEEVAKKAAKSTKKQQEPEATPPLPLEEIKSSIRHLQHLCIDEYYQSSKSSSKHTQSSSKLASNSLHSSNNASIQHIPAISTQQLAELNSIPQLSVSQPRFGSKKHNFSSLTQPDANPGMNSVNQQLVQYNYELSPVAQHTIQHTQMLISSIRSTTDAPNVIYDMDSLQSLSFYADQGDASGNIDTNFDFTSQLNQLLGIKSRTKATNQLVLSIDDAIIPKNPNIENELDALDNDDNDQVEIRFSSLPDALDQINVLFLFQKGYIPHTLAIEYFSRRNDTNNSNDSTSFHHDTPSKPYESLLHLLTQLQHSDYFTPKPLKKCLDIEKMMIKLHSSIVQTLHPATSKKKTSKKTTQLDDTVSKSPKTSRSSKKSPQLLPEATPQSPKSPKSPKSKSTLPNSSLDSEFSLGDAEPNPSPQPHHSLLRSPPHIPLENQRPQTIIDALRMHFPIDDEMDEEPKAIVKKATRVKKSTKKFEAPVLLSSSAESDNPESETSSIQSHQALSPTDEKKKTPTKRTKKSDVTTQGHSIDISLVSNNPIKPPTQKKTKTVVTSENSPDAKTVISIGGVGITVVPEVIKPKRGRPKKIVAESASKSPIEASPSAHKTKSPIKSTQNKTTVPDCDVEIKLKRGRKKKGTLDSDEIITVTTTSNTKNEPPIGGEDGDNDKENEANRSKNVVKKTVSKSSDPPFLDPYTIKQHALRSRLEKLKELKHQQDLLLQKQKSAEKQQLQDLFNQAEATFDIIGEQFETFNAPNYNEFAKKNNLPTMEEQRKQNDREKRAVRAQKKLKSKEIVLGFPGMIQIQHEDGTVSLSPATDNSHGTNHDFDDIDFSNDDSNLQHDTLQSRDLEQDGDDEDATNTQKKSTQKLPNKTPQQLYEEQPEQVTAQALKSLVRSPQRKFLFTDTEEYSTEELPIDPLQYQSPWTKARDEIDLEEIQSTSIYSKARTQLVHQQFTLAYEQQHREQRQDVLNLVERMKEKSADGIHVAPEAQKQLVTQVDDDNLWYGPTHYSALRSMLYRPFKPQIKPNDDTIHNAAETIYSPTNTQEMNLDFNNQAHKGGTDQHHLDGNNHNKKNQNFGHIDFDSIAKEFDQYSSQVGDASNSPHQSSENNSSTQFDPIDALIEAQFDQYKNESHTTDHQGQQQQQQQQNQQSVKQIRPKADRPTSFGIEPSELFRSYTNKMVSHDDDPHQSQQSIQPSPDQIKSNNFHPLQAFTSYFLPFPLDNNGIYTPYYSSIPTPTFYDNLYYLSHEYRSDMYSNDATATAATIINNYTYKTHRLDDVLNTQFKHRTQHTLLEESNNLSKLPKNITSTDIATESVDNIDPTQQSLGAPTPLPVTMHKYSHIVSPLLPLSYPVTFEDDSGIVFDNQNRKAIYDAHGTIYTKPQTFQLPHDQESTTNISETSPEHNNQTQQDDFLQAGSFDLSATKTDASGIPINVESAEKKYKTNSKRSNHLVETDSPLPFFQTQRWPKVYPSIALPPQLLPIRLNNNLTLTTQYNRRIIENISQRDVVRFGLYSMSPYSNNDRTSVYFNDFIPRFATHIQRGDLQWDPHTHTIRSNQDLMNNFELFKSTLHDIDALAPINSDQPQPHGEISSQYRAQSDQYSPSSSLTPRAVNAANSIQNRSLVDFDLLAQNQNQGADSKSMSPWAATATPQPVGTVSAKAHELPLLPSLWYSSAQYHTASDKFIGPKGGWWTQWGSLDSSKGGVGENQDGGWPSKFPLKNGSKKRSKKGDQSLDIDLSDYLTSATCGGEDFTSDHYLDASAPSLPLSQLDGGTLLNSMLPERANTTVGALSEADQDVNSLFLEGMKQTYTPRYGVHIKPGPVEITISPSSQKQQKSSNTTNQPMKSDQYDQNGRLQEDPSSVDVISPPKDSQLSYDVLSSTLPSNLTAWMPYIDQVFVVSGDKDIEQVVSPHVTLIKHNGVPGLKAAMTRKKGRQQVKQIKIPHQHVLHGELSDYPFAAVSVFEHTVNDPLDPLQQFPTEHGSTADWLARPVKPIFGTHIPDSPFYDLAGQSLNEPELEKAKPKKSSTKQNSTNNSTTSPSSSSPSSMESSTHKTDWLLGTTLETTSAFSANDGPTDPRQIYDKSHYQQRTFVDPSSHHAHHSNGTSAYEKGTSYSVFNYEALIRKHGFCPSQLPQFQALTGDSSDNVPGVRGIGPSTAGKLISQYGDLNNVIQVAAMFLGYDSTQTQVLIDRTFARRQHQQECGFEATLGDNEDSILFNPLTYRGYVQPNPHTQGSTQIEEFTPAGSTPQRISKKQGLIDILSRQQAALALNWPLSERLTKQLLNNLDALIISLSLVAMRTDLNVPSPKHTLYTGSDLKHLTRVFHQYNLFAVTNELKALSAQNSENVLKGAYNGEYGELLLDAGLYLHQTRQAMGIKPNQVETVDTTDRDGFISYQHNIPNIPPPVKRKYTHQYSPTGDNPNAPNSTDDNGYFQLAHLRAKKEFSSTKDIIFTDVDAPKYGMDKNLLKISTHSFYRPSYATYGMGTVDGKYHTHHDPYSGIVNVHKKLFKNISNKNATYQRNHLAKQATPKDLSLDIPTLIQDRYVSQQNEQSTKYVKDRWGNTILFLPHEIHQQFVFNLDDNIHDTTRIYSPTALSPAPAPQTSSAFQGTKPSHGFSTARARINRLLFKSQSASMSTSSNNSNNSNIDQSSQFVSLSAPPPTFTSSTGEQFSFFVDIEEDELVPLPEATMQYNGDELETPSSTSATLRDTSKTIYKHGEHTQPSVVTKTTQNNKKRVGQTGIVLNSVCPKSLTDLPLSVVVHGVLSSIDAGIDISASGASLHTNSAFSSSKTSIKPEFKGTTSVRGLFNTIFIGQDNASK